MPYKKPKKPRPKKPPRGKKRYKMSMIALGGFFAAMISCGAPQVKPSPMELSSIPRPHMTIAENCKHADVPEVCGDGLEQAIGESVSVVRRLGLCELSLSTCQSTSGFSEQYWQGEIDSRDDKISAYKSHRYIWGAIGSTLGIVLGLVFSSI